MFIVDFFSRVLEVRRFLIDVIGMVSILSMVDFCLIRFIREGKVGKVKLFFGREKLRLFLYFCFKL